MLPGNCWSKSHSIGPARRLLWLRPRLDGEFKLRPSQIWIAMACTTMFTFYPLCCFPPLCIRISLGKNYASPGLTTGLFYDSRLSHNLQSYHGEGRATITRYNFLPAYANPWLKSQNRKAPPPKQAKKFGCEFVSAESPFKRG